MSAEEDSVPVIDHPFATPQQMEARTQGHITEATHPYLVDELKAATRAIRAYCGWHIAPKLAIGFTRRGLDPLDTVWLPGMHVEAIHDVSLDGRPLPSAEVEEVEFDPDTGWTNLRGQRVAVTFTAGFDPVPEDVVSLTLQVAARALGSPLGIVREQAGSVSVTHTQIGSSQAGGTLLLPAEKEALTPYRLGRLP